MAKLAERFKNIAEGKGGLKFDPLANDEARLSTIRLDDIQVDSTQPRKDLGNLEELKASIQEHGIIQPLVVSPLDDSRFLLVAGERRYTAAKQLGLRTVPALVRTVKLHQRLELQLVENLHRKDLNPIEEAQGYKRLMDEFGLTQDQVAKRVGKSQPVINETLRVLDLPQPIIDDYRTSDNVSKSLLLEIVKQPTEEKQTDLWRQAKTGQLTVKKARDQKPKKKATKPQPAVHTIKTKGASVTVRFQKASFTKEDLIDALQEALNLQTGTNES